MKEAWFYAPNLSIYDFYDGSVHVPALPDYGAAFVYGSLNEAELPPECKFQLFMGGFDKVEDPHLFSYRDGTFTESGTVAEKK